MKLFKKLMAGAMAIAMLSAYTVALAGETNPNQQSEEIQGVGNYAGNATAVFSVTLPTADSANSKVAFTVDPQGIIAHSPPADAGDDSHFGTVFFKKQIAAVEASGDDPAVPAHDAYDSTSETLTVTSMSSVAVVVNMFASLSDTKMTLNDSATFGDSGKHLYLGVAVDDAAATPITELGAKNATTLAAVATNFITTVDADGKYVMVQKTADPEATPPVELADWNKVEYTITGASNANADWNIEGIDAPTLTIKWVVDPANVITTPLTAVDPNADAEADPPVAATWVGQLDKAAYKVGETVTLYVKPVDATKKVKSVTFDYVSVNSKDPTVTDKIVNQKTTVGDTVVNGVYIVTFTLPSNMAKSGMETGTGTGAVAYKAPVFSVTLV